MGGWNFLANPNKEVMFEIPPPPPPVVVVTGAPVVDGTCGSLLFLVDILSGLLVDSGSALCG